MKDFFKFEWKKIVLPVILIILFFLVINSFLFIGSTLDKYLCRTIALAHDIKTYQEQNDTLSIHQTADKLTALSQEMKDKINYYGYMENPIVFMGIIDPVLPVPCEVLLSSNDFCRSYSKEETYICVNDAISDNTSDSSLISIEQKEYTPISFIDIVLNIIFLFSEGYLISSLVLFGYRKIMPKRK